MDAGLQQDHLCFSQQELMVGWKLGISLKIKGLLFWPTKYKDKVVILQIIDTHHFQVQEGPANCLAAHPEGFLICIGGDSGEVSLIQLSSSLVDVTKVVFFLK